MNSYDEPDERQAALEIPELIRGECDWRYDADGCFEVTLCSWSIEGRCCDDCYPDADCIDEDKEAAEHQALLESNGLEVVTMSGAGWGGYSCYTPVEGPHRRARVRWAA